MGSVNGTVFSVMGPNNYQIIRLEYFPVMIRSRIAGNNSLRIFPVGNAHGDNGIYPVGRNYYTRNSKTIKSVSVSVIFP